MADSTAVARYRVITNGVDIDQVATDFEAEAGITKAEVVGHVNEDELTNDPATAIASRNEVQVEVTGSDSDSAADAEDAVIAAATAVGDVELIETAAAPTGGSAGFTLTADEPTLVADDDTPTQEEGATQVVVTLTLTQKAGDAGTATYVTDIDDVYADGNGTVVGSDEGDDTFEIAIDTETGDAALSPFVFTVTATDALGQSVSEVVTLTVTAP